MKPLKTSYLKGGNYSSFWSLKDDDSSLSHFILLKFVSGIMGTKFFLEGRHRLFVSFKGSEK